jgi:hypothetical protein
VGRTTNLMFDWRRWRDLDATDRLLLVEAVFAVAVARASVRLLPFHRTMDLFGLQKPQKKQPGTPEAGESVPDGAFRPAWAVEAAADRMPIAGTCLAKALAGSAILGRRGIASTIHLGVANDPQHVDRLIAHAWLCCGDTILTGAAGVGRYTPLATFAVRPAGPAPSRPQLALRLLHGRLGRCKSERLMIRKIAMRPDGALRGLLPSPATMRVVYGDGSVAKIAWHVAVRPFECAAKLARALAV